MKIKLILLSILLFSNVCFAKLELTSESEIQQVMDDLVDNTDPITEKNHKASIKLIKKGIKNHDRRKFDKAIKSYNKALKKNPLSALAYYELGLSFFSKDNIETAYEHALKALALEPGLEGAHVLKASLLDDAGYIDESLQAWSTLIDINPKSYMAWLNKGITHLKIEQIMLAEEAFTTAIEIDSKHPSAYFFMFALNNLLGYTYLEEDYLRSYMEVAKGDHRKEIAEKRLKEIEDHRNSIHLNPDDSSIMAQVAGQLYRVQWRSIKHRKTYPNEKFYRPSLEEEQEVTKALVDTLSELNSNGKLESESDIKLLNQLNMIIQAGFVKEKAFVELKDSLGKKDLEWGEKNNYRIQKYLSWSKLNPS